MFSGFNILDSQKPHDILHDIQENKLTSFSHTEIPHISFIDPSFHSSSGLLESTVPESHFQRFSKSINIKNIYSVSKKRPEKMLV